MILFENMLRDWDTPSPFYITKFQEKTISNSMPREEMMNGKKRWNSKKEIEGHFYANIKEILLEPMEVRTFTFYAENSFYMD